MWVSYSLFLKIDLARVKYKSFSQLINKLVLNMSCSCTKTVCATVLVILGVVLVIVGGISLQVFKIIFDAILTDVRLFSDY